MAAAAVAVVVTPVKQQQSSFSAHKLPSRSGSRRKLVERRTPINSRAVAMNGVHNALGPALSVSVSSRKRTRESTSSAVNNISNINNGAEGLLDEDSDLIRNGRALFAATTTSLAAPLDIPNKRRRTLDPAVGAAPQAVSLLATPKQTSTLLNAVGYNKQQISSKKKASTGKSRASRTRGNGEGSIPLTAEEKRSKQEEAVADWSRRYARAIQDFTFYLDCFEDSRRRECERCLRLLGAVSVACHPFFKGIAERLHTSENGVVLFQERNACCDNQANSR